MSEKEHGEVSAFTLDVYWASGRSGDAALDAHIAGCSRCQAYLESLAALEAAAVREGKQLHAPDPEGAKGAPAPGSPVPATIKPRWRRVVAAAGGALALAASVFAVIRTRPPAPEGYVGVKGAPAVQVLVRRDRDTRVWDGRAPIRPGDALALRVACEGLGHVAVAGHGPTGWARLSDAACPTDGAPLPFTLIVDGEPGEERIALVLSREAMDDRALREAIEETRRTRDVWAVELVLPKATGSER
jgi:hypothetical protein